MSLLEVSGISIAEERGIVLKDISFTQQEFQQVAIAGETGSGKSTLLKIVAGLVQPDAGKIYFEGEEVIGPREKLVPGHPGISYLSQHFELPKSLRVEQVLKYANTLSAEEAEKLYEVCRITHLLKRRTDQLSGGEKQRIAMARLLSSAPKLLLLDEPYSNLDMVHKSVLKSVIRDIGEQLDITCIMISHDPQDILSWADEILVMKEGRIQQQGPPEQIYRQPVNEYVAGLFGKYNLLDPTLLAGQEGLQLNGKRILVRPENLQVVAEGPHTLEGVIRKVSFLGSFYETEVQLTKGSGTVTLKAAKPSGAKGSTVHMALAQERLWQL